METILGLFKRGEDADRTVKALIKAGFSKDELSILSNEELLVSMVLSDEQTYGSSELKEVVAESAGNLLGALAPLVIPVENARLYAEGVKHGGALVITRTTSDLAPAAEMIMVAARADEVRSISSHGFADVSNGLPHEPEVDEREFPLLWRVLQGAC